MNIKNPEHPIYKIHPLAKWILGAAVAMAAVMANYQNWKTEIPALRKDVTVLQVADITKTKDIEYIKENVKDIKYGVDTLIAMHLQANRGNRMSTGPQ